MSHRLDGHAKLAAVSIAGDAWAVDAEQRALLRLRLSASRAGYALPVARASRYAWMKPSSAPSRTPWALPAS